MLLVLGQPCLAWCRGSADQAQQLHAAAGTGRYLFAYLFAYKSPNERAFFECLGQGSLHPLTMLLLLIPAATGFSGLLAFRSET